MVDVYFYVPKLASVQVAEALKLPEEPGSHVPRERDPHTDYLNYLKDVQRVLEQTADNSLPS